MTPNAKFILGAGTAVLVAGGAAFSLLPTPPLPEPEFTNPRLQQVQGLVEGIRSQLIPDQDVPGQQVAQTRAPSASKPKEIE